MAFSSPYAWLYLDPRYGPTSIAWPTEQQLLDALADIYNESCLAAVDQGYRETVPATELRCGIEDGPLYHLRIEEGHLEGGQIHYCKYQDWDDTEAVWCYARDNVPYETAREWWLMLAQGHYNLLAERIQQWTARPRQRWHIFGLFRK